MTMSLFGPDMAPTGTSDVSGDSPLSTERRLQEAMAHIDFNNAASVTAARALAGQYLAANAQFAQPADPYTGEVDANTQLINAAAANYDMLGARAKELASAASGGDGGLSANTMAQVAQQDRQLAESMRQFDISTAQSNAQHADTMAFNREQLGANVDESKQNRAEQQRANNLSSTLDMLTNQIKVGELGINEASNRISAATQAANVQRDILADHAGKALPAGTTAYPNLGANGPIAAAAQALGMPFKPFETLGTFSIDPNAIAAPISSAAGQSVLPGVNANVAAAAQALAGMGVPHMAAGGVVEGPYMTGENGPELNFPMGNGRNFVLPNHALGGGASIPQGELPGQGRPWNIPQWGNRQMMDPGGGGGVPRDFSQPLQGWYNQLQSRVPPQLLQRIQQALAGLPYGMPPPSPGGAQLRPPQMGIQSAVRSMVGG